MFAGGCVHLAVVDVAAFDYELPPGAIAQTPAAARDAARLLVLDRARQALADHVFADLPALLRPGDCVVLNNSRVIPARVLARDAGGRAVALADDGRPIGPEQLSDRLRLAADTPATPPTLNEAIERLKRRMIEDALRECGSKTRAAERLGLSRQSLQQMLRRRQP